MEALATIVILLHPLAALVIIREFLNQRKWRQEKINLQNETLDEEEKINLQNETLDEAISRHEKTGNRIFLYVIFVILLAFISKIIYFQINNGTVSLLDIIPNHFHGWAGILGLLLMVYLRQLGMKAGKT